MKQLSPDQLAYHAAAYAGLLRAQGAWDSWIAHLAAVHKLQPDERILAETGAIVSMAPALALEPPPREASPSANGQMPEAVAARMDSENTA